MTQQQIYENLNSRLDRIERASLLGAKTVLDLDEAAMFTGYSTGYLYRLTSNRKIPHSKQGGKLFFEKARLERWLLENEVPTEQELNAKATTHIILNRK